MSRRKQIKSKQLFDNALKLEREGDTTAALKGYQRSVTTDPANTHAWNRQMVLLRKSGAKEAEVKLIKTAIEQFQATSETKRKEWLDTHQEKAANTKELAQLLGQLEPSGLPKAEDSILEKWQTRLYLLEYRINNARKKKTPKAKKPALQKSTPKASTLKSKTTTPEKAPKTKAKPKTKTKPAK